jgi:hypothetical protein
MTALKHGYGVPLAVVIIAAGAFLATRSHSEASTTVEALARATHFHGIAVESTDPLRLYLATHHGLYAVEPDGSATQLSPVQDFMGFTPHPTDRSILYASGHPEGGGNLGFIASEDGGRSWSQLAEGAGGPEGLIALAASSTDPNLLYAATQVGLLKSEDGGRSWQDAYWLRTPATMVHVTPDGAVYAFVVGTGLIQTVEPKLSWQTVNRDGFDGDYVLHVAVDPSSHGKLYAVSIDPQSYTQAVLASDDAGKTWAPLGSTGNGNE